MSMNKAPEKLLTAEDVLKPEYEDAIARGEHLGASPDNWRDIVPKTTNDGKSLVDYTIDELQAHVGKAFRFGFDNPTLSTKGQVAPGVLIETAPSWVNDFLMRVFVNGQDLRNYRNFVQTILEKDPAGKNSKLFSPYSSSKEQDEIMKRYGIEFPKCPLPIEVVAKRRQTDPLLAMLLSEALLGKPPH